jgi:uncharacterized protein with GYD domain
VAQVSDLEEGGATMTTFILFGKYTMEGLKGMSAERTEDALDVIEKCGGQVQAMYAVLGPYDLVFVLSFPSTEDAMKCSVFLARMTGIAFATAPAVSVEQFDSMISET